MTGWWKLLRTVILKSTLFGFISFLLTAPLQLNPACADSRDSIIHFKAMDIHGNVVPLSGKNKNLLLFFNPSNTFDKMKLFYAQALYYKFKDHGLQIIGVAKGEIPRLLNFAKKSRIQFPLVLDKDYQIHGQFGVTECCAATILVDKTNKIKFFLPGLMESENLRQLIEKETRGKINYRFNRVNQDVFFLNERVPDVRLTEYDTGEEVSFYSMDGNFLAVTFFSSLCGVCKTGKRIRSLIEVEKTLTSSGKGKEFKFVLVFMGPFDTEDVLEWEKRIPMPFEKYFADYLFSEEEKYITEPSQKNDPLTIILNKKRNVVFIEEAGIDEKSFPGVLLQFISRRNNED